ncbi:hypothetical protein FHT29_000052 [Rhizobium sp. SG741]|nr:hypothetical protein [Rhizobium sp. SG741]
MTKVHETMMSEGICPRCGDGAWRDSVDVGVGVIHGPYGCACGWSESEKYDLEFGGGLQANGSYLDMQGGLLTARNPIARMLAREAGI